VLEEIDGQLVQHLQRDGRASYQALGRAVGLTRTAARARVSRLLQRGVITVVALPDAAVTGQTVVAHLSADVTGSALAAAHAIARLGSAVFVSVASGQFPVIADLRSPGEAALAADLDRLRALPGIRGIETVRALTLVRDAYRPRPGHPAVAADATDRLLISGLERDGRMSYADLAGLAGLSAAATRSRVLRLIRGGAVHVTVLVDAAHTGRLARAGLGITVHGPAQAIAEQIAGLPDVTYVLTGTGRFDVIAAADTSSETSLLRTIENIRVLPGVNRVHSWRHLQIVKESYPRMTPPDHPVASPRLSSHAVDRARGVRDGAHPYLVQRGPEPAAVADGIGPLVQRRAQPVGQGAGRALEQEQPGAPEQVGQFPGAAGGRGRRAEVAPGRDLPTRAGRGVQLGAPGPGRPARRPSVADLRARVRQAPHRPDRHPGPGSLTARTTARSSKIFHYSERARVRARSPPHAPPGPSAAGEGALPGGYASGRVQIRTVVPPELASRRLSGENAMALNSSCPASRDALMVRPAVRSRTEKDGPWSAARGDQRVSTGQFKRCRWQP